MRLLIITTVFTLAMSPSAWALSILTVKNDKALISLGGQSVQAGDRLGARDAEGKPRAVLLVQQVKGERAIVIIQKGKLEKEYSLTVLKSPTSSGSSDTASASSEKESLRPSSAKDNESWGFMLGYAMTNMSVAINGGSSVSMTGSSINLSGYYEMQLDGGFSTRILGGYESLNAKGTAGANVCGGATTSSCNVDISYLGLEALVLYKFMQRNTFDVWAGAGLGFLFAMSKSSNLLDTGKISTNQTLVGSFGVDYRLSKTNYIPMQLDYAIFPDNSTSSAKQMIFRVGYGYQF